MRQLSCSSRCSACRCRPPLSQIWWRARRAGGLILAALAARGHSQPGQTIAAFRGSAPALVDYIAAEVLAGQPPELRAFLLRSAALDRFSAELCDALRDESATPEPPAAELLAQIERANLFLIALDDERRWFRYHHLFAEVLRAHVARSDPAALRVTRLRAASWLADHGATAEAIGLALAAEEWPLAAQLIAEVGRSTLLRSEVLTLRGWLQALPPATRSASPPLLLLDGWVRVLLSDLDGAAELAKAVSASATEFQGEVQMLLTMIAILRGAATAQPVAVGKGSAFLKIIATLNEGFLAQFSGDVPAAIQAFVAATQSNQAEGNDLISFIAWCQLGEVQILQGRPRAAEASYRRARDLAYSAGERQAPFADAALVGLGVAAYERGDLEQAASLITAGLSRRSILGDLAAVDGLQHLALLAALRGDNQEAAEHLRAAEAVVESLSASIFTTIVVAGQAQLIARSNDRAAATAWLASNPPPTAEPTLSAEIAMLARAQVLQMLGQHRATLDLATLVAEQAAAGGRGRHQAQALVLRALALAGLGQHAAARVALAEAHALADPTGMVAVFLEAGPALAALEQPHTPELLTPREIEVLRLIEAGLSNGEIAAQIVVAPSTVKKHINRIFDKLAVGSRTQALARARTLGLLG
jgi:LuxR family maltose regulon positive regulatory protein